LASGRDLDIAIMFGNKASGVVVGKVGTTVITKKELDI